VVAAGWRLLLIVSLGEDGDAVQEDWLGVPMLFGGIGREATEAALREIGYQLKFSEAQGGVEEDGATVPFLWVIARKPSYLLGGTSCSRFRHETTL
jgi:hypothetical protein